MKLETERLIIRNFRASDVADFVEYRSDPEVCEFQGYEPFTEEMGRGYIESLKDGTFGETGKWNQLAVELKSEKKLIGDIGIKPEAGHPGTVECGISFSTKYQGKGLAKEALIKVFDYLFAEKNIHRVIGIVDVKNTSAVRLLENLNFRREAEFKESFWDEGKNAWCDEFLYAMLEKDWETNQK